MIQSHLWHWHRPQPIEEELILLPGWLLGGYAQCHWQCAPLQPFSLPLGCMISCTDVFTLSACAQGFHFQGHHDKTAGWGRPGRGGRWGSGSLRLCCLLRNVLQGKSFKRRRSSIRIHAATFARKDDWLVTICAWRVCEHTPSLPHFEQHLWPLGMWKQLKYITVQQTKSEGLFFEEPSSCENGY